MYNDRITELEEELRKELIDVITEPTELAKAFSIMKKFTHLNIKAVLHDYELTLTAKTKSVLDQFPE